MTELQISILSLIFGSILPILIFKSRTRSEIVLNQKSPFIIELFISLSKLHSKVKSFSAVVTTQSQDEIGKELFDGLDALIKEIRDHQARAKLYLHRSTNSYIDDFITTSFELIRSRNMHIWMLSQKGAFTSEDLAKEYEKWSKILPDKLKDLYVEKITPSLRFELNGYWNCILLDRDLIL